jgi:hypothetical protein
LVPEKEPERRLLGPWIAAGAKLAHFPGGEAATRHSGGGFGLRLQWAESKDLREERLEGKSGASSRGNSSSRSIYVRCCS